MSLSSQMQQSMTGLQLEPVFTSVPAAANQALIGQRVRGAVLTVAGVYTAEVDIAGLSAIECFLKATIAASTVTSDVYTTYKDGTTKKDAFAGVGALADGVLQKSTRSPVGEQKAIIKLTLGAAPNATITVCEVNGN